MVNARGNFWHFPKHVTFSDCLFSLQVDNKELFFVFGGVVLEFLCVTTSAFERVIPENQRGYQVIFSDNKLALKHRYHE